MVRVGIMKSLQERFESKIMPEPNSGCWLWLGSLTHNGYGSIWANGRLKRAPRVSYELHVGIIPHGLEIDHLCRVRCCVNPDHLEAVTRKENARRGYYGQKTHCPQGHPYSGDNLYVRPNGKGRDCRKCKALRMNRYRAARRIKEGSILIEPEVH